MRQQTFVYKTVSDLDIHLDVYTPQGLSEAAPALLWIHGGALIGGNRGDDRTAQFKRYFEAGYRMISVDYRLAPETKLPEIIADVRDAIDWIHERGWQRLGVVGHSAGGYLALMTGTFQKPPRAIVSFYGYGDLVGPWYSKPDPFYCKKPKVTKEEAFKYYSGPPVTGMDQREGVDPFYLYCRQNGLWPTEIAGRDPNAEPKFFIPFCPEENVTASYPATLLLHGDEDTDVPCDLSVRMAQKLTEAGVKNELIVIRGGGHGFEEGPGEDDPVVHGAWKRVIDFLSNHL